MLRRDGEDDRNRNQQPGDGGGNNANNNQNQNLNQEVVRGPPLENPGDDHVGMVPPPPEGAVAVPANPVEEAENEQDDDAFVQEAIASVLFAHLDQIEGIFSIKSNLRFWFTWRRMFHYIS